MPAADEVVETGPERAALTALREAAGEDDTPMERHAVRVFVIAERMAKERNLPFDREVALCASFLHDVAVFEAATRGVHYLKDGRGLARKVLSDSLAEDRLLRCLDTIERHHDVRPQWERGAEIEFVRRADVIDGFPTLVRSTLDRRWLRDMFKRVPREGMYKQFLFPPRRFVRVVPFLILSLVNAVVFAFRPA